MTDYQNELVMEHLIWSTGSSEPESQFPTDRY